MRILIDTNIYCDAMRGISNVVAVIKESLEIVISPIVIGELLSGFRLGKRERENRKELGEFLSSPRVRQIEITPETAEWFSLVFSDLRKQGTPLPTNDMWLAASAFEYGLRLVSQDAHFQKIRGLNLLVP